MIRYQIFENDVTTAGGIVQRHTGGGNLSYRITDWQVISVIK